MMTRYKFAQLMIGSLLIVACNNGPKEIAPASDAGGGDKGSGIFATNPAIQVTLNSDTSFNEDLHEVIVEEVLQADRYVYLNVKEEGNGQFWIATRKQEAKEGEVYFYRRPLMKTNFESKEYNRVFDTIYLVSNLVAQNHANSASILNKLPKAPKPSASIKENIPTHTDKPEVFKGAIKIAELVKDPKKFAGSSIQLTGKCVKVNPNIMDRNWIHLQDGSKNDFDLVITTASYVSEGSTVTIKAVVGLNRDFGAGYKYDLILEDGILVK